MAAPCMSTTAMRRPRSWTGSWPRPGAVLRWSEPPPPKLFGNLRRFVLITLAVLVVAAACGQSQASPSHELVLGAIYPLSGPQAAGGKEELAGVKAALAVAESSGALRVPVRLDVVDATTPRAAAAAVDHLVRD